MDIGAGKGGDISKYSRYANKVYVVEPSAQDLEKAKEKVKELKLK